MVEFWGNFKTSTILLSIKPKYVAKIFDGSKRYEFRRSLPKQPFDKIVIYESFPTMKIVGECGIESIITDTPQNVWEIAREFSGTSEEHFQTYFLGKTYANAIKLKNVKKYSMPKSLEDLGIRHAPQSFCYLK